MAHRATPSEQPDTAALRQVRALDVGVAGQVSQGASHLDDPVQGAQG